MDSSGKPSVTAHDYGFEKFGNSGLSPDKDLEQLSHQGLDRRRLTRVREYIAATSRAILQSLSSRRSRA